jgi:hypothetical protein
VSVSVCVCVCVCVCAWLLLRLRYHIFVCSVCVLEEVSRLSCLVPLLSIRTLEIVFS